MRNDAGVGHFENAHNARFLIHGACVDAKATSELDLNLLC
jgi:hypothetical protein